MHTQHGFCVCDCQRLTGRIAGGAGLPDGRVLGGGNAERLFFLMYLQGHLQLRAHGQRLLRHFSACVFFCGAHGNIGSFCWTRLQLVYHNEPPFLFSWNWVRIADITYIAWREVESFVA